MNNIFLIILSLSKIFQTKISMIGEAKSPNLTFKLIYCENQANYVKTHSKQTIIELCLVKFPVNH